jgi:hypothetical protein
VSGKLHIPNYLPVGKEAPTERERERERGGRERENMTVSSS